MAKHRYLSTSLHAITSQNTTIVRHHTENIKSQRQELNGNLQLGKPKQNKYAKCKHAGRESTILTQLFMKISSNLTQKTINTIKNSSLLLTCILLNAIWSCQLHNSSLKFRGLRSEYMTQTCSPKVKLIILQCIQWALPRIHYTEAMPHMLKYMKSQKNFNMTSYYDKQGSHLIKVFTHTLFKIILVIYFYIAYFMF